MQFAEYIQRIRLRLANGAPGESYQLKMAPVHRMPASAYLKEGIEYRQAAVMVLLVPDIETNEPSVVLIERSVYSGVHSGQIALPGGKPEGEESLSATALRELEEETGIAAVEPELIGELTALYIPPSRFLVYPFVAVLDYLPSLLPQEREVQRIFTLPVHQLDPDSALEREFETSDGIKVKAPFYALDHGAGIWGATAMILSELYALHQK